MKTTDLNVFPRTDIGKRHTKTLRREGKVPAVIYRNSEVDHITVDAKEVRPAVYTAETYIVKLNMDGKVTNTVIRGIDFHPVTEKIEHIEFLQVSDDKPVVLTLPLELTGTPKGVITGGKLLIKQRKIKVKGFASKLPERITLDVSQLELGDTVKVSSIEAGDFQIMTSPSAAVASVEIPRSLRSATSKAGGGDEDAGAEEEVE
ncbi:MAG: 50S ribosomal protein L25 [Bacteroidota bacterium]